MDAGNARPGRGAAAAMPVNTQWTEARQGDRYLQWDELRPRPPLEGFTNAHGRFAAASWL